MSPFARHEDDGPVDTRAQHRLLKLQAVETGHRQIENRAARQRRVVAGEKFPGRGKSLDRMAHGAHQA